MSARPRGSCSCAWWAWPSRLRRGRTGFPGPFTARTLHRLGTLRFHQPGQVATEVRLRLERILARVDSQELDEA